VFRVGSNLGLYVRRDRWRLVFETRSVP